MCMSVVLKQSENTRTRVSVYHTQTIREHSQTFVFVQHRGTNQSTELKYFGSVHVGTIHDQRTELKCFGSVHVGTIRDQS